MFCDFSIDDCVLLLVCTVYLVAHIKRAVRSIGRPINDIVYDVFVSQIYDR